MTDLDTLVADVIAAAGGRVVGRVRLQKIFYLLEQLGLGGKLPYEYHHFGPYSSELAAAVADATAFKLVEERLDRRMDGVAYSVFITSSPPPLRVGTIDLATGRAALEKMQSCTSTVLELAATIHWLAITEKVADWRSELRRRKGVKTEAGRTEAAVSLLQQLGLQSAVK